MRFSPPLYLTHARAVLPDRTLADAAVLLVDGRIEAVCPERAPPGAREIDLGGSLLLPGMIDLHCDALEKEVEPRPHVHFPLDFACAQADRRNAAAGITTVFHALSFASHELGVRNNAFAARIAAAVTAWRPHALVDNRVHVRYEITDEDAPPLISELMRDGHAQLLSFMDHTPGQGQFKDVGAFHGYLSGTYGTLRAEVDAIVERKRAAAQGALRRMSELAALARVLGLPIASHDDDTPQKVAMMSALGATISEFPINPDTARAARGCAMATLFGAPNVLRGRSQSGSMRALDAVLEGVADCLCGDYAPAALLPAVLRLPELAGIELHQAVALVSANPARAAGLDDRGRIAAGLRADLVAVRQVGDVPQAACVWIGGVPAFGTHLHRLADAVG